MKKAIIFPAKYLQGDGVLSELGDVIKAYQCKKPMVVWGKRTKEAAKDVVLSSLEKSQLTVVEWAFGGECSHEECARIEAAILLNHCDCVVGLGGGKCLDVAKGAAAHLGLRMICAPTVCSSDAPTSACTVWYSEDGVCVGFDLWQSNPDVVIADTGMMVKAPERMLVAGIGDALATYLEARVSSMNHRGTCAFGTPTLAVEALAKLCFNTILDYSDLALQAAKVGVVTPAFDKVVEACTLLSGIGWESGGLCAAHQLGNNFSMFEPCHHYMHGEKVAFGLITQLMLDPDQDLEQIYQVVDFMVEVGLPVSFADLGLDTVTKEQLLNFCEQMVQPGSFVGNFSFQATGHELFNAMLMADQFGRTRKALADCC